ncbi:hypothetical protein 2 [Hubei sobemo-like virus 32]|uniref:hypothetical protein 2 n=1 Tax=Hubei sobemo-like virus 32 TaxID=1923219 RepID=UPI000909CBC5|nr:hypothetical protein 2 [Hubei sobemo-like virus 32]APG75830.1 hypothetical protein 2 [Hubei sobemo-like virus 32]
MVCDRMVSCKWRIPSDFLTRGHFDRVVRELEWTSSPGYPYCVRHPTNAQFFEVVDGQPSQIALDRVWYMVVQRLRDQTSDPIRLFIKPEAHKMSKLLEHRYRIISSVSVIDQIIDHMLFQEFNDRVVENVHYVPAKVGWTPYIGGWKMIRPHGMVSADKTAWDWTVPMWMLDWEFQVRVKLCENMTEQWLDLAAWRYNKLFVDVTLVTSGGLLLKQRLPGAMKSGSVNTIVSNSIMQDLMHCYICNKLDIPVGHIWTLGDDTIQEDPGEEYFEELKKLCVIKEIVRGTEFAGHTFDGMHVSPNYVGKHAYTLLHVDLRHAKEICMSYALLYHRAKPSDKELIYTALRSLGETLPSEAKLDLVFDGSE